jgi:hypothetical protein
MKKKRWFNKGGVVCGVLFVFLLIVKLIPIFTLGEDKFRNFDFLLGWLGGSAFLGEW